MNYFDILLAQKTGYIPHNYFDALFARRTGGAVLKDFPGLPASIVTVTDALAMPLDSLKVAINPVQSGSGDPSPDNVRPISGWTGAKIYRTGTNVWDEEWESGGYSITNGQPVITLGIRSKNYNPCNPNTAYYVFGAYYIFWYDADKNYIGYNTAGVRTSPSGARFFHLRMDGVTTYNHDISINYPSTDHDYHAYAGDTLSVSWESEAGIVYGGSLDVTNGVLTVDRAMVDLGSLNWARSTTGQSGKYRFSAPVSGIKKATDFVSLAHAISSQYATASWVDTYNCVDGTLGSSPTTETIAVFDSNHETATVGEFKTSISGVQLCYELATPITYQLTPTEVQMLLGTNNIWADTGEILEGKYYGKKSSATRAMLNTVRDTGEITEITPEEPEESDER